MSPLDQLASAALIGTAQQPYAPPASAGAAALDASLQRLPREGGSAELLLSAAALLTGYRASGAVPARDPRPLAPAAEPDPRPIALGVAAAHLETILSTRRVLAGEWLDLAHESGKRPAPELIPSLLEAATQDRTLRVRVARAAAALGPWLAQFRPEWSWVTSALAAAGEAGWETGSLPERLAVLRGLRGGERPGRARELVEAVWTSENADARKQFVEALGTAGLSMDDEPFLEAALDDRSGQVRAAAVELLSTLSASRLIGRMRERVAAAVTLNKEGLLGRRKVLTVDLLGEPGAAAQRDGLDKKPPASKELGARGWWTLTAIAAIPPSEWCARFAMEPAALIEAAANGQWQALLMSAWATAAGRHRDKPWLTALIPRMPSPLLFAPLEPAERERLLLEGLAANKELLLVASACCAHPWSAAFTERFGKAARAYVAGAEMDYRLRNAFEQAALHASTAAPMPYDADQIPLLAAMLDTIAFRRQMRKALFEPVPDETRSEERTDA